MATRIKTVVTGAAGHLGSHLVPALLSAGFDVTGLDMADRPPLLPDAAGFEKVDLTDAARLKDVLADAELIVHCASIHPWKKYPDDAYHDCNIKGTWNLYSAASALGIRRVVMTSSIAAIGYGSVPVEAWPVTEDNLFPIGDLYSLTKNVQETIARMFGTRDQIRTIALRPPPFMPRSELDTGFSLTGVFALVDDMVSAHVAAARTLAGLREPPEPLGTFEAFFAMNKLPYTRADLALLGADRNVKPLVRQYWPDACDWLAAHGYDGVRLIALYDLSKIERLLGWRPAHNFEEWFAEHGK